MLFIRGRVYYDRHRKAAFAQHRITKDGLAKLVLNAPISNSEEYDEIVLSLLTERVRQPHPGSCKRF